ncbi:cation/H(+) antiporter 28-like [Panicum virgatum]|uniref:cation/H(+) antiporter 28-like n=1 Tax=Panicum virgatum TaxID=38727 RepID=UPI0019D50085|nr:cation/H(+) antiporter 28-like [Panicum virgatum]
MGLQHHDPSGELRLVVGLHGPQDVSTLVCLMEALRCGGELAAYTVDMVQLTDQTAVAIVKGRGFDGMTVVDEEVLEMRKLIGEALDAYQAECGGPGGMRVRRLLALSSFPDMHSGICMCAEDAMAALVLLPFHKAQRVDGSMDAGHFGFRLVNQKVLQLAPCSVGVVVDRGLGKQEQAVMVFIGGADDREPHVAGGGRGMGYLEKHVAGGAELVAVLRGLQSEYRLFMVGRGRDWSSVLMEGLDEWAECLELGPVGDILASSDFSPTASVLIVQQYDAKKHYKVIDDEFLPLYLAN